MTSADANLTPPAQPQQASKEGRGVRWWGWAGLGVLLLVLSLSTPWLARSVAGSLLHRSLIKQGWEHVELKVSHVGFSQMRVENIVLKRSEAHVQLAGVSVSYSLGSLLRKQQVEAVIASRAQIDAHFANSPADLIGAAMLLQWPQQGRLPFQRLYLSDAQINLPQRAGLRHLRFNALIEEAANSGEALLWLDASSPAPDLRLNVSAEANLAQRSLKIALDAAVNNLTQWRSVPLPAEAHTLLNASREQLTLQAAFSLQGRSLSNWMLVGQTPAIVLSAADGSHLEAVRVDFGANILGADKLEYAWLRSASGAAQNSSGSIEWHNLSAELKPGKHANLHAESAHLQAELSSIARGLMPSMRIGLELPASWRNRPWEAQNLSATVFARQDARPAFYHLSGNLSFGTFTYPWEQIKPVGKEAEALLRTVPLLDTLLDEAAQQQEIAP